MFKYSSKMKNKVVRTLLKRYKKKSKFKFQKNPIFIKFIS